MDYSKKESIALRKLGIPESDNPVFSFFGTDGKPLGAKAENHFTPVKQSQFKNLIRQTRVNLTDKEILDLVKSFGPATSSGK